MSANDITDDMLKDYMIRVGRSARQAYSDLSSRAGDERRAALEAMARSIRTQTDVILSGNEVDLKAAQGRGISGAMLDRLALDMGRVTSIAESVEAIADQEDPIGAVLEEWTQPNGLHFKKVAVPIGVIGMIYESRPNVTADAAALCIKSGNAVVLRGGSEAVHSNRALYDAIQLGLAESGLPTDSVQLLQTQDRAAVGHLLSGLKGGIDLIIPRGGKGLVERVQTDARVPVLAHLDGLNHTYVHSDADLEMARDVVLNAKMRRTGICGATETLLVDREVPLSFLTELSTKMTEMGCELRGDDASRAAHHDIRTASEHDYRTEHLAPILNIKVVSGLESALDHISTYGSGHTEAIVTRDEAAAQTFLDRVDAAIVLHNASTQFADGGEFGFGAEIGIATGRLHARGPVGARQLTSYKYQVVGTGTTRP